MEKVTIHGVAADNYGSSPYSHGMDAIIFSTKNTSIEEVSEMDGVYLNPIKEADDLDIFALQGTQEQYEKLYFELVESHCASEAFRLVNGGKMPDKNDKETRDAIQVMKKELERMFVPWFAYLFEVEENEPEIEYE